MLERAAEVAGLGIKAHPHILRHACGYALANAGHDTRALQAYLGHKNIQHTLDTLSLPRRGSRTFGGTSVAQP
jgi:type 1 fimbriae regulatory protein FimB/type 1 fimbriae regulatory protein FimE